MRKHWVIFITSLMLSHFLWAQPVYFNNRYDLGNDHVYTCSASNSIFGVSGGYIAAAEVDSLCNWGRVGLLKVDSLGNKVFERKYGTGIHSYGIGIKALLLSNDNNYLLAGYKDSALILWKFDKNGDTLWTRTYYDTLYYLSSSTCQLTRDKGIIVVGLAQEKKTGLRQILLLKADSSGKQQWKKIFTSSSNDWGYSVDTCRDGGYIVGSGWNNAQLTKIDSSGKMIWQYNYSSATGLAGGVITTKKGKFVFISAWGTVHKETGFFEVSDSGKLLMSNHYNDTGTSTGPSTLIELNNGHFLDVGQVTDGNTVDGSLLLIDSTGNLLWYRNYKKLKAPNSQNYLRDVKSTLDGGFIASGFCIPSAPDTGKQDVWVIKLDSNGCDSIGHCSSVITSLPEKLDESENVKIYPNPNNGIFTVALQVETGGTQIEIFDMLGQSIYKRELHSAYKSINITSQPPGIYLYRVISGNLNLISSGKFIIQK